MKKSIFVSVFLIWCCGCGSPKIQTTGFLTDYSRLQKQSETSFKYAPSPENLGAYSKFIIEPVRVHFHAGSGAIEERTKGKLTKQDVKDLQDYMHKSLIAALSDRYEIVSRPGHDVARVKVALTDLKKSTVILNIMPTAKATGVGLGAATMEAEIIDSRTGQQLRALVEMQRGNRLSLDGLSKWGDAKAVMDKWARSLRSRIDEAHDN
jgi:hypothetical protein